MRTQSRRSASRLSHLDLPSVRGGSLRQPGRVAATLFGLTRRQVLGLTYGRPDQAFYAREVARTTGGAIGAVQRELQELVSAGILERTERGRQVYYQANRQCPIFEELRTIVAKTSGLVDVLLAALSGPADRIEVAFVFGSMANGTGGNNSDVDLFVVGEVSFGDVVDALVGTSESLGREVNPVVQSAREFRRRVSAGDHFVSRLLGGPRMFVIGDDDVLDRLGTQRVAGAAHDKPAGNSRTARRGPARPARQPVK